MAFSILDWVGNAKGLVPDPVEKYFQIYLIPPLHSRWQQWVTIPLRALFMFLYHFNNIQICSFL